MLAYLICLGLMLLGLLMQYIFVIYPKSKSRIYGLNKIINSPKSQEKIFALITAVKAGEELKEQLGGLNKSEKAKRARISRYRKYGFSWKKIAEIYEISPTTAMRWSMVCFNLKELSKLDVITTAEEKKIINLGDESYTALWDIYSETAKASTNKFKIFFDDLYEGWVDKLLYTEVDRNNCIKSVCSWAFRKAIMTFDQNQNVNFGIFLSDLIIKSLKTYIDNFLEQMREERINLLESD